MFHKRAAPDYAEADSAAKRLKANIQDLWLGNDLSAPRVASIFEQAAAAGVAGMGEFACTTSGKNLARDMTRRILKDNKGNKWPPLYVANCKLFEPKTQCEKVCPVAFLLPHEVVAKFVRKNGLDQCCISDGLCENSKQHLLLCQQKMQCENLVGLAYWGDGVPCTFDKNQSIEVMSWFLPGLMGVDQNIRIPFSIINKRYFTADHATIDDCMQIFAWSMKALFCGEYPEYDHTGVKLTGRRAQLAGTSLGCKGVLLEVRGDWAYFKSAFRLPQHNEGAGICWLCEAKPADVRQPSSSASWRTSRLSHWQLLRRQLALGCTISPIMSIPFVQNSIFLQDWQHCADQGILVDWLGGLFRYLLRKFPGTTQQERTQNLFVDIQTYYSTAVDLPGKLDNLTYKMLGPIGKPPKLRARAGEARGLVMYGYLAATRLLDNNNPLEQSIKQAMYHLHQCYCNLSKEAFSAANLREHSRRFAVLYVAIEERVNDPCLFWVKPKLHQLQELCEMKQSCPSLFWNYRNEDFGGHVMQVAKKRGGRHSPYSLSANLLRKFTGKNALPFLGQGL